MQDVVIRNATLWDGTGAPARPGHTIHLHGDTVAWIGPESSPHASSLPSGAGTMTIDAAGRWLLPGLIDLHVHLTFDPRDPDFLRVATLTPVAEAAFRGAHHARLMLEAGFTGVRDMGAFGDATATWAPACLEGVYQKWLATLGAGDALRVVQIGEPDEFGSIEYQLSL